MVPSSEGEEKRVRNSPASTEVREGGVLIIASAQLYNLFLHFKFQLDSNLDKFWKLK